MRRKSLSIVGVLSTLVALALFATTTRIATARSTESTSDRVGRALAQASVPQEASHLISASSGKVSIDPKQPAASITSPQGSVRVTLAGAATAGAEASSSGQSYGDVAPATDALVRAQPGGVQVLSIMQTPSAPSTQRYQLDLPAGTRLEPVGEGFLIVDANGGVRGAVAAPWAKDAAGRSLPTRYAVDGTTLVQHTDTAGARFPVVADPKLTFGVGVYLNMWGSELRATAAWITAMGGVTAAVACDLKGQLPSQLLRSLANLICRVSSTDILKATFRKVLEIFRSGRIRDAWCYQRRLNTGDYWKHVGDKNCR
jgi:hypothetical protein